MSGRGIPLRVGLEAATLVLVACGLLASGVAVTSIIRHTLINRVDETLLDAEPALPDSNDVGPVPVTVGSIDHSDVQWRAMTVRGLHGELTTVAIDLSD